MAIRFNHSAKGRSSMRVATAMVAGLALLWAASAQAQDQLPGPEGDLDRHRLRCVRLVSRRSQTGGVFLG